MIGQELDIEFDGQLNEHMAADQDLQDEIEAEVEGINEAAVDPGEVELEMQGEDDMDEAREEELQVQTVAARLVDLLALKVPARHVLPEVLQFASQALAEGAANGDAKRRHAAVAVLGIVCEGCAEGLQRRAPEILPKVVESLRDSSPDVRGGAAFTLGQMAEYLQLGYDFPHMHRDVLPALFAVLPTEPDKRVQERMMYAMDSWLEQLDDEVAPYVEPLLQISYIALDSPDARPQVKEMLLSACASAAAAAGGAMHPHLPALLPRLERCLTATEDKDLKPRARALEVLGMLVSARGGRAAMEAHVPAIMAAADSGFDLDYSELREYGHGMYAEVAEALGEGFAPYLPGCVEKAAASLRLDDGVVYDSDEEEHDRARRSMVPGGDSDDDGEDLSDSDGDGGNGTYDRRGRADVRAARTGSSIGLIEKSTAKSTTEPPRSVGTFGISVSTTKARIGASGVSRMLKSAVWPDGTRFAPSAKVTDAMANSSPKAERT